MAGAGWFSSYGLVNILEQSSEWISRRPLHAPSLSYPDPRLNVRMLLGGHIHRCGVNSMILAV